MKKKNNAGFSIVEVLIALAIFTILMIPIVKTLIQSLKMSTSSKELQYRNQFAEVLMEHVKAGDIDEIEDADFYTNVGATLTSTPSRNETPGKYSVEVTKPDGTTETKSLDTVAYQIKGKVDLGSTKKTTYNFLVDVDSDQYAKLYSEGKTNRDINNQAIGLVESIDYQNVALIDDQIFNYDSEAVVALKAKKLQALKAVNEEAYRKELEGKTTNFNTHEGLRMMTIKISGSKDEGYLVQCILDYYDPYTYLGSEVEDHIVEYNAYGKSFDDELPNIYVMYNPCLYNNMYVAKDYISIDVSELEFDSSKPEDVNVFLIETASNYSQDIKDSGALSDEEKDKALYYEKYTYGEGRDDTKVYMNAIVGSSSTKLLENINVYTNIGDNYIISYDEDGNEIKTPKGNKKTYIDNRITDSVDLNAERFVNYQKKHTGLSLNLYPLTGNSGLNDKNAKIEFLNQSQDDFYGLYNVKVYLKKESDGEIDMTTDVPILQGTKGGNES